jgi:MFS family permease
LQHGNDAHHMSLSKETGCGMKSKIIQLKLIALATAVCLLGDSMLYVVLPVFYEQFGLTSLWQVGVLLAVNRFVRLPLGPAVGWFYARFSIRSGMITAIVIACLTTAAYGILQGFWLLLLIRGLWGIAWALLRLGALLYIPEMSGDVHRGYYFGVYKGITKLGTLSGIMAGGLLVGWIGLLPTTVIFSVFTLLSLPIAALYLQPHRLSTNATASNISIKFMLADRRVLWVLFTGFWLCLLYQGILKSSVSYMIVLRQTDYILGGLLVTASAVGGMIHSFAQLWEPILSPIVGRWSDRTGRRGLTLLFMTLACLSLCLIPFHLSFPIWIAVLIIIFLCEIPLFTLLDASASDTAAITNRLSFMTGYTIISDLGAAIGPIIGFFIINTLGMQALLYGLIACMFMLCAGKVIEIITIGGWNVAKENSH